MLYQISWTNYIQIIAVLLVVYYLLVVYIYYRQDLQLLFSKKEPAFAKSNSLTNTNLPEEEPAQYLVDEARALIIQASYSRSPKEEILFALQKLLSSERFQPLHESRFRDAIDNLIINECQTNCSMHLSEDDLKRLWVSK